MAAIVPLLYARCLEIAEVAMTVLMTMLVITLKEFHQEEASAAKYGNIGDVIGQYTPVQASPKDGTEFPYWLIVWPMMAAEGRSPAEGLKGTTWRLGTMGSMGCLCAIGGMTQAEARSKQGVAATARMKPPIGIYLIIFFIKGGTQPPTKGNGDTGVQIEQEVGPSIPSPHQRLLWPRASTSRRASTREPSALTSGEPPRLLRA